MHSSLEEDIYSGELGFITMRPPLSVAPMHRSKIGFCLYRNDSEYKLKLAFLLSLTFM